MPVYGSLSTTQSISVEIDSTSNQGNITNANYWIKVAEADAGDGDKATAVIGIDLAGKEGDYRAQALVYLNHGDDVAINYDVCIDIIDSANTTNPFSANDFILTYDIDTEKSQLWVRSTQQYMKCYATIIQGTKKPDDANTTGYELTVGSSWAASITSLGADLTATHTDRTFNEVTSTTFIGALSGNATTATTATNVAVADESSDASCNVLFTTAASGNLPPKSGTNLTFNSSSGLLTATLLAGDLTGDVTGNADSATTATTATNVTVADESSDTTCNILFTTAPSGNLPPKSGTNLTFNSNSGLLTATLLAGDLTGNATTATTLASARTIGGVSFDGSAPIVPATITVADTTDTTSFVGLWESATGNLAPKSDAALTYNAGTGTLTVGTKIICGDFEGNADTATVATTATATQTTNSSTYHLNFVNGGSTGNKGILQSSGNANALQCNPGTGTLIARVFDGDLSGDVTGHITKQINPTWHDYHHHFDADNPTIQLPPPGTAYSFLSNVSNSGLNQSYTADGHSITSSDRYYWIAPSKMRLIGWKVRLTVDLGAPTITLTVKKGGDNDGGISGGMSTHATTDTQTINYDDIGYPYGAGGTTGTITYSDDPNDWIEEGEAISAYLTWGSHTSDTDAWIKIVAIWEHDWTGHF